MKPGDFRGERPHIRERQTPLRRHAVIEAALRESAHNQHPFDRVPLAFRPKAEIAACPAPYGQDLDVKLRRSPSVEAKLVEQGQAPLFNRREVQKRVFDRPLDLVGEVSGQKNVGCVGLDTLYSCRRGLIRCRAPHEFQKLSLAHLPSLRLLTIA